MRRSFGPWSTSLGEGSQPALSTFWRRRLSLLPAVRRSGPTVSRRELLRLGAAGAALAALPTLRLASALEPASLADDAGKAAPPGRIYAHARLDTGDGEIEGIFAIDPKTASWTKVGDRAGHLSRDGKWLAYGLPAAT